MRLINTNQQSVVRTVTIQFRSSRRSPITKHTTTQVPKTKRDNLSIYYHPNFLLSRPPPLPLSAPPARTLCTPPAAIRFHPLPSLAQFSRPPTAEAFIASRCTSTPPFPQINYPTNARYSSPVALFLSSPEAPLPSLLVRKILGLQNLL